MSGIGAVFNLDGRPVERACLERMAASMRSWGPDGADLFLDGFAGLVHRHFWTTPEEWEEKQPVSLPGVGLHVSADARLDNRQELMGRLQEDSPWQTSAPSDAQLILSAYRRWGTDCAARLLGDFAFAIWDRERRILYCARDPIGARQILYCRRGPRVIAASTVGAVLAALQQHPELNRPFLEDMLAGKHDRWVEETAYRQVRRLPPGHCLVVEQSGLNLRRYWVLGGRPPAPLKDDREYLAQFRELFERSVAARLRVAGRSVGLLVSGGLDSSSVAVIADRLARSGRIRSTPHLYSNVFQRTPMADEGEFLEALVKHCSSSKTTEITADDAWGLREFGTDDGYALEEPEISVDRLVVTQLLRRAQKDGARVVLSGHWGDQVLGGGYYHIPTLLRDLPLRRLGRELRHFERANRLPGWALLAYAYLRPLLPAVVRSWLTAVRSRRRGESVESQLRAPSSQAENRLPPPRLSSLPARLCYESIMGGLQASRMAVIQNWAAHAGVDWRFPFLDRRLVEFLLVVPSRVLFGDGFAKQLLRRGLADVLPARIRDRQGATVIDELIHRGLCNEERGRIEGLLENSKLVEMGLLDGRTLRAEWNSYWADPRQVRRPLIAALCVEAWLRNEEKRSDKP